MKRIIICADGTWNIRDQVDKETGRRRPTNVTKLARAVLPRASNGVDQVVYYHDGIGTGGPMDRITAKVIAKILHRSESAVRYRLAVLGKSSRFHKEGYARRALAEELHLGIKTVQRFIVDGLLEVRDPRITNRSLHELSKRLCRPSSTAEKRPAVSETIPHESEPSESPGPPATHVSAGSPGVVPTRASRAKRFWAEAATTLGVSLETVEQYILKGVLKLCDPRIIESSLRRFCRRNGSLISSDFLNSETRSWLKDVMDLVPNAGKTS